MRAAVRGLELLPDPRSLPDDPAQFRLLAQMTVGPPDSPSEESSDITVCTPEWLARACSEAGGIYDPRHPLVVDYTDFDERALRAWLSARMQEVEAATWAELGERLGRLGRWEFEDYRP